MITFPLPSQRCEQAHVNSSSYLYPLVTKLKSESMNVSEEHIASIVGHLQDLEGSMPTRRQIFRQYLEEILDQDPLLEKIFKITSPYLASPLGEFEATPNLGFTPEETSQVIEQFNKNVAPFTEKIQQRTEYRSYPLKCESYQFLNSIFSSREVAATVQDKIFPLLTRCLPLTSQEEKLEVIEEASNILLPYLDQEELNPLPLPWYEKVFSEPFKNRFLDEPLNGDSQKIEEATAPLRFIVENNIKEEEKILSATCEFMGHCTWDESLDLSQIETQIANSLRSNRQIMQEAFKKEIVNYFKKKAFLMPLDLLTRTLKDYESVLSPTSLCLLLNQNKESTELPFNWKFQEYDSLAPHSKKLWKNTHNFGLTFDEVDQVIEQFNVKLGSFIKEIDQIRADILNLQISDLTSKIFACNDMRIQVQGNLFNCLTCCLSTSSQTKNRKIIKDVSSIFLSYCKEADLKPFPSTWYEQSFSVPFGNPLQSEHINEDLEKIEHAIEPLRYIVENKIKDNETVRTNALEFLKRCKWNRNLNNQKIQSDIVKSLKFNLAILQLDFLEEIEQYFETETIPIPLDLLNEALEGYESILSPENFLTLLNQNKDKTFLTFDWTLSERNRQPALDQKIFRLISGVFASDEIQIKAQENLLACLMPCLASSSQAEKLKIIEAASNILLSYLDQEELNPFPLQWYEDTFSKPYQDPFLAEPLCKDPEKIQWAIEPLRHIVENKIEDKEEICKAALEFVERCNHSGNLNTEEVQFQIATSLGLNRKHIQFAFQKSIKNYFQLEEIPPSP